MPEILVLGIGNILMGDDGIGVHIANKLLQEKLPDGVKVIDGGTLGISLLPLICGAKTLIIVDAIDAGLQPGEMMEVWFDTPHTAAKEVMVHRTAPLSLHEFDIWQALGTAQLLGKCPKKVALIGIQVGSIKPLCELSPNLRERMDEYVAFVKDACLRLSSASIAIQSKHHTCASSQGNETKELA